MSDKVKLPSEVAKAIEYFRNNENLNNSEIVWQVHQVDQHTKQGEAIRDYAADNYDDFLRAVVNGYEVEQTPEEIIIQLYKKGLSITDKDVEGRLNGAFRLGIQNALTIVGIYIKGVNAE